jgi:hypothetical protein
MSADRHRPKAMGGTEIGDGGSEHLGSPVDWIDVHHHPSWERRRTGPLGVDRTTPRRGGAPTWDA